MRKAEEEQGMMLLRCGRAVLLGGAVAFLTCLGFLLLASIAVSCGLLGGELRYQLTVAGCVVGSFVGGLAASRLCSLRTILTGLLVGTVLFLFQLTLGILFYDAMSPENGGLGLLLGALCGGMAAGILGRGGERRKPKAKKRRKS